MRSEVFAVQAACKHCNLRMGNLSRTAGGADTTHYAVKGFFCALVVFAALCVCNVLHYVQALCTCIGTCITADTCINLRVELHHNLLARVDFFHVVYCLYQREERESSNIHIVLNLRGAGKTGLQLTLTGNTVNCCAGTAETVTAATAAYQLVTCIFHSLHNGEAFGYFVFFSEQINTYH